jgi:hypothetical protein
MSCSLLEHEMCKTLADLIAAEAGAISRRATRLVSERLPQQIRPCASNCETNGGLHVAERFEHRRTPSSLDTRFSSSALGRLHPNAWILCCVGVWWAKHSISSRGFEARWCCADYLWMSKFLACKGRERRSVLQRDADVWGVAYVAWTYSSHLYILYLHYLAICPVESFSSEGFEMF